MTALHDKSIIALSSWLKTPAGRYALAWEQEHFDLVVADIFGFNAVQIGLLELPALRNNRIPFAFHVGEILDDSAPTVPVVQEATPRTRPMVFTRLEELPFAAQSVDLLVLPHALEFADDPHQVLREVERVLIPEGQLIITGFNPGSLWGVRQFLGRIADAPFLPSAGQFLALQRLRDWLKLLGFDVNRGRFGCYRPPFHSEKWLQRLAFLEKAGDRWWPICGAVYMVSATKRVPGMRLIGPVRKERKAPAPALAPTTNRGALPSARPKASYEHAEAGQDY